MSWSGGVYTKGNSLTGGWAGDASAGIGIEAGRHDTQDNDFATGINQCLNKDGSNAATGNLNLGANKITALANGSNATDAMAYGQIRNGTPLYMDTTNNRLGINTSTPVSQLDVSLNTATVGTNGVVIQEFSNDIVSGEVNFRKSRSATIGTNTIVQNGDLLGAIRFWGANGTGYDSGAIVAAICDGTPGATNDMPTRLVFYTTPDGSGTVAERMRINNAGVVSINDTPDAIYRLRVGGRLRIGASTAGEAELGWGSASTPANIAFSCSVRTDIGGNNDDLKIFRVNPSTGAYIGICLQISNSSGEVYVGGSTDNGAYNLQCNGTGVWGAGAYVNGSDERIKDDIVPINECLNLVNALNPVTFKYKESWTSDQKTQSGFIAQELQQVFDGENYLEGLVNVDGPYLSVAYQNLIPVLTKAIQELNAKVEALESRIVALES